MDTHSDNECLDGTADLPPLWPKLVLKRDNDGKVRLPPPSDKLVFGPVARPSASPVPSEPLLHSDSAD
ncbi:hypothetical protein ACTMTI_44245 [Nonomuraea sp. H19]|uniref:hypothetical protein n=1 Tax=Nonomuraea sp. H19 TaxID=3452206 RepID=UPI003F88E928